MSLGNLLTVCPLSTGQARRHNYLFIPVKNRVSISLQANVDISLQLRVRTEVGNGHTLRQRAFGLNINVEEACLEQRRPQRINHDEQVVDWEARYLLPYVGFPVIPGDLV